MFLFRFKSFIAPVFIRVLYYIGLVFIVVGGIGATVYQATSGYAEPAMLIAAPFGIIISVFFWRFMIEAWLVIFEINDRLGKLVDRA
ncbi:MAG: DUF4282 domain-containing protein [Hyphococcus sp.]